MPMKNSTFTFLPKNEFLNKNQNTKLASERPSEKSIDFILNYSKSLLVKKSRMIDTIQIHLN